VDDEDLIQAARDGQPHAGPFLVSLFAPMLLGHARALAGDLGDAVCEDICEFAIERAVRKIDLFDPEKGSFAAWARSQLRYVALDYRRDHARVQSTSDLELPAQEPLSTRDIPDGVMIAVSHAMAKLSDADQAILALREIEHLPSGTVATLLGITDQAVRQRHSRARRRLAQLARQDERLTEFLQGGLP
jgi:RNA polymerase sigma factor (sigma-70 family)